MKGKEIIDEFESGVKAVDPELMQKVQVLAVNSQMKILALHARTLACACECMGMDAENNASEHPRYIYKHFKRTLIKWELINEEGGSLI